MNEPLRKCYSRAEMEAHAKRFLKGLYGSPMDLTDEARDRWMERFGLLIHFIGEHFPETHALPAFDSPPPPPTPQSQGGGQ
jgi:hypothetical protein